MTGKMQKHFTMLKYLSLLLPCLILGSCRPANQEPGDDRPPNIVFILADDLGWADLPMYGNTFNEAPNLMQLAREGMQFNQAYAAAPVCSPTRASIQSGQYPARVGIIDFITGHWRPYEALTVPTNRTQYLPTDIETIGENLQRAGYATGYFGKWHLGWADEHLPGNQGYDDWRIQRGGSFYQLKTKRGIYPFDSTLTDDQRLSEVLTDYSLRFMEKNQDQPFFLFLSHYDVHVQLDADQDLIDKYRQKENPGEYPGNAVYAAMIEHIDRSVGRILQGLDELNLAGNTLVVFFSDNGGLVRRYDRIPLLAESKLPVYAGSELQYVASSNAPLRSEKGTLYEGGIREPLLIRWPGKVPAGSSSTALISSVDFYPTFSELAQTELPADQVIDGTSFLDILQGAPPAEERALFWHYPVYHHDVPASAVRRGDWKYLEYYDGQPPGLYHLSADIGESRNLAAEFPQKKDSLQQLLQSWKAGIRARDPVPNPAFAADRRTEWGKHPDRN